MPTSSPSPCSAVASAAPFPPKLQPPMWCPGINRTSTLFNGLALAYPFWENTGKLVQDYSGNGQSATLTSLDWSNLTNYGPSLYNNTISGQVIPTIPDSTDFAVSIWFTTALNNNSQEVIDFGVDSTVLCTDNGSDSLIILASEGTNINFYASVDGNQASLCYIFETNVWHHVVMSRQGSLITCYVNGQPVGTLNIVTASGTFTWSDIRIGAGYIGVGGGDLAPLLGNIGQFMIWQRPLLPGEVTDLFVDPWRMFTPPIQPQYSIFQSASALLACVSSVTAVAKVTHNAVASLNCVATITATPNVPPRAFLTCESTVTATAKVTHNAIASLGCVASVTATGSRIRRGIATLSCVASITAVGNLIKNASASLAATSKLNALANLNGFDFAGGALVGGTAVPEVNYNGPVGDGGALVGGTAPLVTTRWAYPASGELVLGGSSSSEVEANLLLAATSKLNALANLNGFDFAGGALVGGEAATEINYNGPVDDGGAEIGGTAPLVTTRWAYPATGGFVLGGQDNPILHIAFGNSGGLILGGTNLPEMRAVYTPSGGLTIGSSIFDPVGVEVTWAIAIESTWNILTTIEKTLTFKWDVGSQVLRYYQVEGECLYPPTCDLTGIETNDSQCSSGGARFMETIAAESLGDLCTKLQERFLNYPVKWPISKIKRFSRPVYTDDIDADEARGIDHSCNSLETQEYCQVPECFEFCVGEDVVVSIGASVTIQDRFYSVSSEGGLLFSGQVPSEEDQGTDPLGGFTLGGHVHPVMNHFAISGSGGLIIDGEAGVVSSAWKYTGSDGLLLEGQSAVVSSNYQFITSGDLALLGISELDMQFDFVPVNPLLTLAGSPNIYANLIFGSISVGNLTLGGAATSKCSNFNSTGSGGFELGGTVSPTSSVGQYTSSGGLTLASTYKLKKSMTADGGITLAGIAPSGLHLSHVPSGGVVLGDGFIVTGSTGYSATMSGNMILGGEIDTNWIVLGEFDAEFTSSVELDLFEPAFATFADDETTLTEDVANITETCGCNPLPLKLLMSHNIDKGAIFKEFLARNKFSMPTALNLTYNKFDHTWRTSNHFRGSGVEKNVMEDWIVLFEWGCSSELGETTLDETVWKFSVLIVRIKSGGTGVERSETRILYTFPTDPTCVNNQIDFGFTIDTQTGDVETPVGLFVQDSILADEVGLFTGKFWEKNSELIINVSGTELPDETPTFDIKPIFPEALTV